MGLNQSRNQQSAPGVNDCVRGRIDAADGADAVIPYQQIALKNRSAGVHGDDASVFN
ncbi:hypothetical protein SDC9_110509 [bioreactor metagenome]|uniref:Uncharacterized protein n=1 Tax=bioreactor metagenome TaxID=1076179 RepID=A0A645BEZ5_9ZZZZ